METRNAQLFAVLAHLSFFFLPLILPLIFLFVKNDDLFVRHHARQALIFHVAFLVSMWVSSWLVVILIGIPLLVIVGVAGLVLTIVATIRTLNNEYYRYPITGYWFE